jgi:hypothetical protein
MATYGLDGCNDTFTVRMSHIDQPTHRPTALRLAARRWPALGIVALCGCLLLGCGHAGSKTAAVSCFDGRAPSVGQVPAHSLAALRASVLRVLPQRVGRLYEEGTALASYAWTDQDPAPPPVSAKALRPDGYEMRWIAPNGDDVVATALSFSSAGEARRFMALATSARCRVHGVSGSAARPPLSRNLGWVNPDGVAEADVYLARGRRVYRVGDVPASQQADHAAGADLGRSFFTVDALACLLPGAHCLQRSRSVPT